MAPKQFLAPKVWRRPYTSIYNDNYRFGNSLYSGAIDDIERKYHESMSRTAYRADRPDLHFESFAGHAGSPGASDARHLLEHDYGQTSAELSKSSSSPRIFSNYAREELSRLNDSLSGRSFEHELDTTRRRRRRPDSGYFGDASTSSPSEMAAQNLSMERCRELQVELDRLSNHIIDAETRVRNETTALKSKVGIETNAMMLALEDQARVCNDLQKTIKKQQHEIHDLQTNYESTQRAYGDALDELSQIQKKAVQLGHEVDYLRGTLDQAIFKTPRPIR